MNNELYHHGILGQRWGKQNGPPYPLDDDTSSEIKKDGRRRKNEEYSPTRRDQRKLYKAIRRSKNKNKVTQAISKLKIKKTNPIDKHLDRVMSDQQKEDIRSHIEENEQMRRDWLDIGHEYGFNSKQAKSAIHDYWKSSNALNKEIEGYTKAVLGRYRHKKIVGMRNGHKAYIGEAEMFVKNRIRQRAIQESYKMLKAQRMQELLEEQEERYDE